MSIILFLTYWTIAAILAIFLNLFWKSPQELRNNLKNMHFPNSHIMTILGYTVMYILLPFTIPISIWHVATMIYNTYFKK